LTKDVKDILVHNNIKAEDIPHFIPIRQTSVS
jgi:hypothetical protein